MLRNTLLLSALFTASVFGVIRDEEDAQKAGSIHLQGITEADEVRVDGELVNAAGLARGGYVLLLAPGEYFITVKKADTGKTEASRVRIRQGEDVREPVKLARAIR